MAKILSENRDEPSVQKSRAVPLGRAVGAVHSDFSEANQIFLKFYAPAAVFSLLFCLPANNQSE